MGRLGFSSPRCALWAGMAATARAGRKIDISPRRQRGFRDLSATEWGGWDFRPFAGRFWLVWLCGSCGVVTGEKCQIRFLVCSGSMSYVFRESIGKVIVHDVAARWTSLTGGWAHSPLSISPGPTDSLFPRSRVGTPLRDALRRMATPLPACRNDAERRRKRSDAGAWERG